MSMQPGEFSSASIPNSVSWHFDSLAPPSPLYVQRDDVLLVRAWTAQTSASVRVAYRILEPSGRVVKGQSVFQLLTGRVGNNFEIPLAEGFLLSVVVDDGTNPPVTGQEYCEVLLFQGPATNGFNEWMLCCGYLTGMHHVSWPPGRNVAPAEGPGWIHSIAVTNPAPGADFTYTVPTLARQKIVAVFAQLVTAVAVATRMVELIVDDGSNIYLRSAASVTQAASLTVFYTATAYGFTSATQPSDAQLHIPNGITLPSGHRIKSNTNNLQAADQWSSIVLLVEDWVSA